MAEELIIYEAQAAIAKTNNKNYLIQPWAGAPTTTLKRDVDFGVIPKTKKPSLYKSGAEKICMSYGLFQRYEIESKVERADGDTPFFYYLVKCSLVKLVDGKEYVFCTSYGSANTSEKRNGFNGAYDAANSTLKMAQKRALTGAAIAISGLSDLFTQDLDNEDFMKTAYDVATAKDDDVISPKQRQRIFAIAAEHGMSNTQTQNWLKAQGFVSAKDIKQKDYDALCDALDKTNNTKNESGCKLL